MAKETTLMVNFPEMTDEELYAFRDKLSVLHAKFDDEWVEELKIISNQDGFDPYSYWGERKIKKLAKKHAQKTSGLLYLESLTAEELRKRDKFKEEQMYSGKGKYAGRTMTTEEFIEREQIKTESYKTNR